MKRLSLLLIGLLVVSTVARSVPAKLVTFALAQPDGTMLTVVPWGDDRLHGVATLDGLPLLETSGGGMAYAVVAADGTFAPAPLLAHNEEQRSAEEVAFLAENGDPIKAAMHQLRLQRTRNINMRRVATATTRRQAKALRTASYEGTKRGIVILVNYSDKSMALSNPQATFDAQFNEEGFSESDHIGSVHDYFYDQSYGEFDLLFDVVGPYTLSNTLAYYGTNVNGDDRYLGEMIAEACQLADDDVDFSQYDWDGDGEVDQVFIIYAGYGENAGAPSSTIWPCEWDLASSDYGSTLTLDGVAVNTFACSCELSGTSGTTISGIGIACHEFSHCLGLPDLYDTSTSNNFGMATWSIMDSGTYNGPGQNGEVPCAYTGYERMYAGWLTPTILSSGTVITSMKPITDNDPADVYIVYNEAYADEYYILENRQLESWDTYGYGHGLLVVHVDYDADVWLTNTVNNTSSHQRCTIIPADNSCVYSTSSLAADPYPGTKSNTSLTNTTTPAATLFNANSDGTYYLNKPVTDIAESTTGNISFVFNGGIDAPVALTATNVTGTSFTANWEAVSGAESYNINLYSVASGEGTILYYEDFANIAVVTGASTVLDNALDTYLNSTGWTGKNLYTGYYSDGFHGLKLGTAKATGYLLSPLCDAPESGSVTVYVACETYTTDGALYLTTTIQNASGATIANRTITADGLYTVTAEVSTQYQVKFATVSPYRAWLNEVAILEDAFSLEDVETILNSAASAPRRVSAIASDTGITGTSYTFTGLESGQYYFTVQAVAGDFTSAASEAVYVTLDATGISQLSATADLTDDTPVQVYSPAGILLRTTTLSDWNTALPPGTYLLRLPTQTLKVACK